MAFSFGFSGDDIDEDINDDGGSADASQDSNTEDAPPAAPATTHRLQDLLSTLPSKLSFSKLAIESPKGKIIYIPRRELFDIKLQLMAEDEDSDATTAPVAGLDESDIRTNIYEGGFKTWECAVDLARLLLDRGPRKDIDDLCRVNHVIELGCGTAVPSLVLFYYAVTEGLSLYFTFSDYNAAVLRLVTLPNLILTWASTLSATEGPFSKEEPNPLLNSEGHGDLFLTESIIHAFVNAMNSQGISLTFVSGSWSPSAPFLNFIPTAPDMNTLVLASETIYSPNALSTFTEALIGILQQVRIGKAMVAAKKVYFGVGGSVDAFKIECRERKAVAYEIDNHNMDLGESSGVRRCLMEVQMY